ncbi:hypothetical protein ACJIZ3_001657 [Penstemon smallii]|uniref:DUF3511 domain protein n=1 Tax=Penstemon smallii TaxID=265156 RepID=A0ABD3U476_9LAMI
MAEYRSKSYSYTNEDMQIEPYYGSTSKSNGLRSYSVSYAYTAAPPPPQEVAQPQKLKRGKSTGGSSSKSWMNDPELQRKRRVASYKAYSVEGKVKGSFRKSFRWLKDRYTQVLYGWW